MRTWTRLACTALSAACLPAAAPPPGFTAADVARVETVSDPVFSPDGGQVGYVVTGTAQKADRQQSDLWRVAWVGGPAQPVTRTDAVSEWAPRYLPDGKRIAFLSDQGDETQLWIMPARGGARRQITRIAGGISDYTLSPDGRQAVVVAEVGRRVASKAKVPPPIVITRFQFKADGRDWLDDRRQQLFRVDMATGKADQITQGAFDHSFPAWSPDGRSIAFVSKRCGEADRHRCTGVYAMPAAGGEPRRIGKFEGGDSDPDWEAGGPQWSPDSTRLVWLRAGAERTTWYTPFQLVVGDVATGTARPLAWIDRWFYQPRWAKDGRSILALVEQDRDTWLARIDAQDGTIAYLTQGKRFAAGYAEGSGGRIAVLDGDSDAPAALRTVEPTPRLLSNQNQWLAARPIAPTQDIAFRSGDVEVHGQLVLPPGHQPGQHHPLIVRLHGGPVYQFSHEFMPDWQVYAAHGYAVLGINPRGSSGRGEAFAIAQMARWGTVDVDDIRAGIDHAVAMGVADPKAIGVGGWSYGGILTNYMIASDPRIRAAVSGAGMANFLGGYGVDQYARDYELELGRPWEFPQRWIDLSYPFFKIGRISAPTLYLCAEKDANVPCTGAEQMYQALRSRRVPTELVVYPGQNHGLTVPSYLVDRMQRQLDWYDAYLKAPSPAG